MQLKQNLGTLPSLVIFLQTFCVFPIQLVKPVLLGWHVPSILCLLVMSSYKTNSTLEGLGVDVIVSFICSSQQLLGAVECQEALSAEQVSERPHTGRGICRKDPVIKEPRILAGRAGLQELVAHDFSEFKLVTDTNIFPGHSWFLPLVPALLLTTLPSALKVSSLHSRLCLLQLLPRRLTLASVSQETDPWTLESWLNPESTHCLDSGIESEMGWSRKRKENEVRNPDDKSQLSPFVSGIETCMWKCHTNIELLFRSHALV